MKPTRLDRLAENTLSKSLDEIERTLLEMKTTAQPMNVVYFTSRLSPTYDWQGHIPDDGTGYGDKLFLVAATAQTMEFLWANVYVTLYKGSPPVVYTPGDALADIAADGNYFVTQTFDAPNDTSSASTKTWLVNVTGYSAPLLSVKFAVEALDNVDIVITELN